jgi:hypothetical protein
MNQEAKKTGRELERQVADAYRRMGRGRSSTMSR